MKEIKFVNVHSVKFNTESFALVPITGKKKNIIHTEKLHNLEGGKYSLRRAKNFAVKWKNATFVFQSNNVYINNQNAAAVDGTISQIIVVKNRLFVISTVGTKVWYSMDLEIYMNKVANGENVSLIEDKNVVWIQNIYGKCIRLNNYQDNLMVICQNGLFVINEDLKMKILNADEEKIVKNAALQTVQKIWESDWFGLGYAVDTQYLRDVFLEFESLTGNKLQMTVIVISNKVADNIVTAYTSPEMQTIRVNMRGDQFKIKIIIDTDEDFEVSNLSAIIEFGKR
ncbi:MAG: hypothetical protein LBH47_03750 [Christensenellaceae bacterium]|jgi:hypothetical protein|nr:hypothetical protein [Christensenellaceae bacterium]